MVAIIKSPSKGTKRASYAEAHAVLGKNFLKPSDVCGAWRLWYTAAQMNRLRWSMPSIRKLRIYKDRGLLLLPSPPRTLSLRKVKELCPRMFYSSSSWYDAEQYHFTQHDVIQPGTWIAAEHTNSRFDLEFFSQMRQCHHGLRLPTMAENVWIESTVAIVQGRHLLGATFARTLALGPHHTHVCIGHASDGTLILNSFADAAARPDLGVRFVLDI